MCGIAGLANCGDREVLGRMAHVQAHRGPDDSGLWERRFPDGSYIGLGNMLECGDSERQLRLHLECRFGHDFRLCDKRDWGVDAVSGNGGRNEPDREHESRHRHQFRRPIPLHAGFGHRVHQHLRHQSGWQSYQSWRCRWSVRGCWVQRNRSVLVTAGVSCGYAATHCFSG